MKSFVVPVEKKRYLNLFFVLRGSVALWKDSRVQDGVVMRATHHHPPPRPGSSFSPPSVPVGPKGSLKALTTGHPSTGTHRQLIEARWSLTAQPHSQCVYWTRLHAVLHP